jgi:zinc transport system ATP-binding protein
MLLPINPIIELSGINMRRDNKRILTDVNLTVNDGDFLAVTGPNGGGKTTLLRIILKLLRPTSGTVKYFAEGKATDRLAIGYLPQKNMIDSNFPITVRQVIGSALLTEHLSRQESDQRIAKVIADMELQGYADSPIGNLSGGQLQRALLGRALVSRPRVLILDEPLSYLDKRSEHHIYDILQRIKDSATIILVSHEMSRIATMANRHIIVNRSLTECSSHHHYFSPCCPETD